MARALLRLACVFLLLAAQQGALTHSTWHLRDHLPAYAQHDAAGVAQQTDGDEHSPSSESRLCKLHFALGSVLGGECGALQTVALVDSPPSFEATRTTGYVARTTATPRSRAPPVLL